MAFQCSTFSGTIYNKDKYDENSIRWAVDFVDNLLYLKWQGFDKVPASRRSSQNPRQQPALSDPLKEFNHQINKGSRGRLYQVCGK